MSPAVLKNHIKGLPDALAAGVQEILKLDRELQGAAYDVAARGFQEGIKVDSFKGYAIAVEKQKNREQVPKELIGKIKFIHLDYVRDEDDFATHEKVVAIDPFYKISWLQNTLHDSAESALDIVTSGAVAICRNISVTGKAKPLSRRRGEQIRAINIKKHEEARDFNEGGIGQGGLFDFGGEAL